MRRDGLAVIGVGSQHRPGSRVVSDGNGSWAIALVLDREVSSIVNACGSRVGFGLTISIATTCLLLVVMQVRGIFGCNATARTATAPCINTISY